MPFLFVFPRIDAEIFAFVAAVLGTCFQGSIFFGFHFFEVDFSDKRAKMGGVQFQIGSFVFAWSHTKERRRERFRLFSPFSF